MTEGTWPSAEAIGAIHVPGLFNEKQVEGWKRVTEAVHAAGGRIFVQIGHCGAVSHPDLHGGKLPLAPSAVSVEQPVFTPDGFKTSPIPRAMTPGDIARTIGDYAHATRLAQKAGFDGVELHGSMGYLIPEFLHDEFNLREDRYGGSIENRARFVLEVLEAMIAEWRPGRIGLKLSPGVSPGRLQPTAQTLPTYQYLVSQVSNLKLAYLQFQHPVGDLQDTPVAALNPGTTAYFRPFYDGLLMANGGFTAESARAVLNRGEADLVSFGTPYIANPDLVERFRHGVALAASDQETWYQGGARGYTDYPRATR
ncbi:oxidoreductase [[Erwinia] mediterraneensis]|uniref:oxidoreductase n=1 Tax=[Erwinia] mediterraneensis TaxID=2161819 RepID=UPI001F441A8D|nr:alkene reductase [[Erwinia] mediterraneensis]